ncbi:MAG: hypothetical protein AB1449_13185 [Chloroflexota bacterium]
MAAYGPQGPSWVYDWLALEFNRVALPAGLTLTLLAILVFSDSFASGKGGVRPLGGHAVANPEP